MHRTPRKRSGFILTATRAASVICDVRMRAPTPHVIAQALGASAVMSAILGGAFVGLFSCGAYTFQTPLVRSAVGAASLLALAAWYLAGGLEVPQRLWRGGVFLLFIAAVYLLSEAVAAPFYPAPPESFQEFWSGFIQTLCYGPC